MVITDADLVQRNAAFAAGGSHRGQSFPSGQGLRILSCVDPRVDPALVLGLELGEAVVMRNIGGRMTSATLRSWALLGRLSQEQPPSGHLVLLQHTDCGIKRLAEHPAQLAELFGIPEAELEGQSLADPYEAVRLDVGLAREVFPPSMVVSGLVYDVATGLVEVVVPAKAS